MKGKFDLGKFVILIIYAPFYITALILTFLDQRKQLLLLHRGQENQITIQRQLLFQGQENQKIIQHQSLLPEKHRGQENQITIQLQPLLQGQENQKIIQHQSLLPEKSKHLFLR